MQTDIQKNLIQQLDTALWTQLVSILFASMNTMDHLEHVLPDALRDTA